MGSLIAIDFDGVIVDSLFAHLRAYQENFRKFGRIFPIRTRRGWRQRYDSAWENNYLNNGFTKAELREVLKSYHEHLSYKKVSVFEGIQSTIADLAEHSTLIVVSTTSRETIEQTLLKHRLAKYFKEIVGSSGSSDKSGLLRKALRIARARAAESIMIGDSPADIRAGRTVGAKTIGVTYGWISAARLLRERPDQIVRSPAGILPAVHRLMPE